MTSVSRAADRLMPEQNADQKLIEDQTIADQVLIRELKSAFRAQADPTRAVSQQAYLKSAMPHYGITAPDLRRTAKFLFRDRRIDSRASWEATVLALWRHAGYREERYAAIELLAFKPYRNWFDPALMPLLEELIRTGAWWDFVDNIAINMVGPIFAAYPEVIRPQLEQYADGDDMWLRRTAILAQLKFKQRTDSALLWRCIEPSIDSTEFFLRKAIGWALREYSKTEPARVIDYVEARKADLSGLSKREGLKVLKKQGVVTEIP